MFSPRRGRAGGVAGTLFWPAQGESLARRPFFLCPRAHAAVAPSTFIGARHYLVLARPIRLLLRRRPHAD
jgi:hypothetical protein